MNVTIRDIKTICCAPQKINLVTVKVETSEPGLYGLGCATFAHRHMAVDTRNELLEERTRTEQCTFRSGYGIMGY